MFNLVSANDVDVRRGCIVYNQWLNERGGIETDLTVARLAEGARLRKAPDAVQAPGSATLDLPPRTDLAGDEIAGYVSCGNYGHSLGAAVGLGYGRMSLLPDFPELPSRFDIEVAGVRVPAETSVRPMYDPAGKRVRS